MTSRPNLVLGIVAAVVVALAILAGVLSTGRDRPAPDLATPDGTVEAYLLAIIDNDDDATLALLDPDLGCRAPLQVYVDADDEMAIAIVAVHTTPEGATVVVDITEYESGPFGTWSHQESFDLIAEGSGWLIAGEPWPIHYCE